MAVEPRTSVNRSVTGISTPLMPCLRSWVTHLVHSAGLPGERP